MGGCLTKRKDSKPQHNGYRSGPTATARAAVNQRTYHEPVRPAPAQPQVHHIPEKPGAQTTWKPVAPAPSPTPAPRIGEVLGKAIASFEKYLTEVDVKKQMAIPTDFIGYLPRYEGGRTIFFPVHDVSGNVWENFGYYIRRKDEGYPKPVFQGDWRTFVRAKCLTPGDKIIFRVHENAANGAPRYTIAAQRKVVLLGTTVGWSDEF